MAAQKAAFVVFGGVCGGAWSPISARVASAVHRLIIAVILVFVGFTCDFR